MHVDDWLDDPTTTTSDTIALVKEWLEHFRRPADDQDSEWLRRRRLVCTYQEQRYRCVGCSCLGDVWLSKDLDREAGYDLRVDVTECSDWVIITFSNTWPL